MTEEEDDAGARQPGVARVRCVPDRQDDIHDGVPNCENQRTYQEQVG